MKTYYNIQKYTSLLSALLSSVKEMQNLPPRPVNPYFLFHSGSNPNIAQLCSNSKFCQITFIQSNSVDEGLPDVANSFQTKKAKFELANFALS